MSTFSKTAFVATLALGALMGLNMSQVSGAPFRQLADLFLEQASHGFRDPMRSTATKSFGSASDSLYATFEPDPNDPPTTTGGSGTR
ncbi:hypothetical protein [Myxacorys almedinensis]|uniref:Uncharacterized protein n=1 Tax=Myxacorys almedinensis A TaxID=2690445 RepID=A0A8J7Z279_9CYAN|nr:hypothetical protein [Myxacorys almedinensis]NDJ16831.1 hypothetical protein [Myxacorys almedinensis A]